MSIKKILFLNKLQLIIDFIKNGKQISIFYIQIIAVQNFKKLIGYYNILQR